MARATTRGNDGVVRGCRLDPQAAECVLDFGRADLCLYAGEITRREACCCWQEADAAQAADAEAAPDEAGRLSTPGEGSMLARPSTSRDSDPCPNPVT